MNFTSTKLNIPFTIGTWTSKCTIEIFYFEIYKFPSEKVVVVS